MAVDGPLDLVFNRPAGPFIVEANWDQSGYDIVGYDQRFFAFHQANGAFDYERVMRGEYAVPVHEAATLGELHDILTGKPRTPELRIHHLQAQLRTLEAAIRKTFSNIPPGHYLSPFVAKEDIRDFARFDRNAVTAMPGIAFDIARHTAHLQGMIGEYAAQPPFQKTKVSGERYFYDNDGFWYFDAIAAQHFVIAARPKRVIEVGCGYSTAVMLDTLRRGNIDAQYTMIEPAPERLLDLLEPADLARHTLIKDKIQNVPLATYDRLEANDILFIDSSHVAKFHSDVNFYLFEILPRIKPGVFIHIHDIGYPFEYPPDFLENGMTWTEAYMLRAFLAFNREFRIEFWNAYASHFQGDLIGEKMPLCRQWPGGSFWMSRV